MKKSIHFFSAQKISNPAKIIGGNGGLGPTSGADEQVSTSTSASEVD